MLLGFYPLQIGNAYMGARSHRARGEHCLRYSDGKTKDWVEHQYVRSKNLKGLYGALLKLDVPTTNILTLYDVTDTKVLEDQCHVIRLKDVYDADGYDSLESYKKLYEDCCVGDLTYPDPPLYLTTTPDGGIAVMDGSGQDIFTLSRVG